MLEQRVPAHIINTASRDGLTAGPLLGIYRATKHAAVSISETLYFDLAMAGSSIAVSVVCPGVVHTGIRKSERYRTSEFAGEGIPARLMPGSEEKSVRQGLWPGEVAEQVIQAIHEEKLYVFTSPDDSLYVQKRVEQIISRQNPKTRQPRKQRMLHSRGLTAT